MEEVVPEIELVEGEGDDEAGEGGGEVRFEERDGEFGTALHIVVSIHTSSRLKIRYE